MADPLPRFAEEIAGRAVSVRDFEDEHLGAAAAGDAVEFVHHRTHARGARRDERHEEDREAEVRCDTSRPPRSRGTP